MAVRDKKKQTETGFITAGDRYLFGEGTHYEIYNKLGVLPPEDAPKTNSDKSIDEEDAEIMPELMEGYAEPDDDIDVLTR